MKIEVLGTGCNSCDLMAERVETALTASGVQGTVVRVTDVLDITSYGVSLTPSLVIAGTLHCHGGVPTVEEITDWIRRHVQIPGHGLSD